MIESSDYTIYVLIHNTSANMPYRFLLRSQFVRFFFHLSCWSYRRLLRKKINGNIIRPHSNNNGIFTVQINCIDWRRIFFVRLVSFSFCVCVDYLHSFAMYYSGAVAFRWPFHPLYFRSFRRIQQQYTENVHHYRFRSVIIANVLENYDSILYDALQMFDVSPSPSFKWNQCLHTKHHAGAEHTYTHTLITIG